MAPDYTEALRSLEVEPVLADETMWDRLGLRQPEFDPDLLRTKFFQFDEQFERFTLRRCDDLVAFEKVKILLHATVLEIRANAEGTAIDSVQIGNLRGGRGVCRARVFVVAAGGLETPRLLLNSRGVQSQGLGNQEDLVGRFFKEHPHARAGRVFPTKLWRLLNLLPRTHRQDGLR